MEHCKHKPRFDFKQISLLRTVYVDSGNCKHCGKQIILARPVKVKMITFILETMFFALFLTVLFFIMELCSSRVAMLFCIFSVSIVHYALFAILTGYVIPACSKWVPYVPKEEL